MLSHIDQYSPLLRIRRYSGLFHFQCHITNSHPYVTHHRLVRLLPRQLPIEDTMNLIAGIIPSLQYLIRLLGINRDITDLCAILNLN